MLWRDDHQASRRLAAPGGGRTLTENPRLPTPPPPKHKEQAAQPPPRRSPSPRPLQTTRQGPAACPRNLGNAITWQMVLWDVDNCARWVLAYRNVSPWQRPQSGSSAGRAAAAPSAVPKGGKSFARDAPPSVVPPSLTACFNQFIVLNKTQMVFPIQLDAFKNSQKHLVHINIYIPVSGIITIPCQTGSISCQQ